MLLAPERAYHVYVQKIDQFFILAWNPLDKLDLDLHTRRASFYVKTSDDILSKIKLHARPIELHLPFRIGLRKSRSTHSIGVAYMQH